MMKISHTLLLMIIAAVFVWSQTATAQPPVFINEVDAHSSEGLEFIELFDGGAGNTALDGLVVVLFNGNGDTSYRAFDLDNYSTDVNGYFVLGGPNLRPAPDLAVTSRRFLQDGPDAVALYRGNPADFPRRTGVTIDNLIDAFVYDTKDGDDAGLLILLNDGEPQVDENGQGDQRNHSSQRFPNGSGGLRNTSTYDQHVPTPGAENARPSGDQALAIHQIQGAAHTSPHLDSRVQASGIVTAVDRNGFYLQDPDGDGDDSTSEGLFVYTRSRPDVVVGDSVEVVGAVKEYRSGSSSRRNDLTLTQIADVPTVTRISSNNPLPSPVPVWAGGRQPPTEVIDDDNLRTFDPYSDGIDFYESLEGMRVTIATSQVVAPPRFGKIFIVPASGSTGLNQRGGITIAARDFNPERLLINGRQLLSPGFRPSVGPGDLLGEVTGVVTYFRGNFEVLLTAPPTLRSRPVAREITPLRGGEDHLLVAAYNVKNLDPNDQDGDKDVAEGRFVDIARQIVKNLNQPDIIALQEVQDNSGSRNDGITTADQTLRFLIDSIYKVGGPTYSFIDNPPGNNMDGGQPGGNIRVAFLYDARRVSLIDSERLEDNDGNDAFARTRKPLQATFAFRGNRIILINNHFSSKWGSSPLFGSQQPPINGGFELRREQATFVKAHVDRLLDADPEAKIVVLGDLNEFQFEEPLSILEGTFDGGPQALFNLDASLPKTERYSYIYDGNAQKLDHILVSSALKKLGAGFDVVHVNCEYLDAPSDHDPLVARLTLGN